MAFTSEKQAASCQISALSKKPNKPSNSVNLLRLFSCKRKDNKVFRLDEFPQYEAWGNKDYTAELTMGWSRCPGCRNKMMVTREVQMKDHTTKVIDNLRFEQEIANGAGRLVKTLPCSFEAEFIEFKKCCTEKLDGEEQMDRDRKKYELLWEKGFGVVECVKCKRRIDFVNHVRRYAGMEEVKWFMTYKL